MHAEIQGVSDTVRFYSLLPKEVQHRRPICARAEGRAVHSVLGHRRTDGLRRRK